MIKTTLGFLLSDDFCVPDLEEQLIKNNILNVKIRRFMNKRLENLQNSIVIKY